MTSATRRATWFLSRLALGGLLLGLSAAVAKPKAPAKDAARVTVAIPLGATPGVKTRITIRGYKLDQATAIRFPDAKGTARILSKGRAPVPDKNAGPIGDTQVVAEVTLPSGMPSGTAHFTLVTPAGETPAHGLLVETGIPVVPENEPNNGFKNAQAIQVPQAVDGLIQHPRDVDVFRFDGKAGQKVICEVLAARHGSALDSILTLYDAQGNELASNDDSGETTDSRMEVTLPRAGPYYLSLIDAHDQGGPAHVYRLVIKPGRQG
jgi:hypothetical protein